MPGFSNYLRNALLDHIFGNATFTPPANIFVALSTTEPSGDGSGVTEPSGNGYARVSTSDADWSGASSFEIQNTSDVTFPTATGSWGTVSYFVLYDAASGGNMLIFGALTLSKEIVSGRTPSFTAGDLSITH